MCREVVGILRTLKEQRDMSLNEVRLTVAIEDPRARERRLMGMEVRCCLRPLWCHTCQGKSLTFPHVASTEAAGHACGADGTGPACFLHPAAAVCYQCHWGCCWMIDAKLTIFRS